MPAATVSQAVFNDVITSSWALSGWRSTSTVQNQFVKSGVSAIKVDATQWGGLSLDSRNASTAPTASTYRQPSIMSFTPSAGPAGTVVTLNGSGFTGLNLAWVGAARNGTVAVVSDSQAQVTIPVGATTGAIGIFNPSYTAFTPSAFTVR
jgi:IPT/TIG domain